MKEILEQLGFEHLTGPMWKHKDIGMMHFKLELEDASMIIKRVYDRGWGECQAIIRADLGININH